MKKITLIALSILVVLCAHAQKKETREVGHFTRLSFGVPGKAMVKQGSSTRVELEGDEDVLEKVVAEVEGNRLVIRSKDKWFDWNWGNERITAYITMKEIEGLAVSGSGDLVVQSKIKTSALSLGVSGSGSLTVEADAGDTKADVSGSGNLSVRGTFASLEADISGSGDVDVSGAIAGTLAFDISGSGKCEATGTAQRVEAEITGSGKVLAGDLQVAQCKVRISGSGNVEINVKESLDAKISGSGDVRYRGNPSHVNANSSGSGSVKKIQ
jgi:hypothetical protein